MNAWGKGSGRRGKEKEGERRYIEMDLIGFGGWFFWEA